MSIIKVKNVEKKQDIRRERHPVEQPVSLLPSFSPIRGDVDPTAQIRGRMRRGGLQSSLDCAPDHQKITIATAIPAVSSSGETEEVSPTSEHDIYTSLALQAKRKGIGWWHS
jgi:hypothetical protein